VGIVLFDLDGTLVDSLGDLHAALCGLLAAEGRAGISVGQARKMIGGGARHLLALAWSETGSPADAPTLDRLYPDFLTRYAGLLLERTRPYPGAVEALDALRHHVLAVATNKPIAPTEAILAGLGLRDRFRCVVGGDSLAVRKPDGAILHHVVAQCGGGPAVLVGDSGVDFEAAFNARIPCVGVRWGYRGPSAFQPDAWIAHYRELPPRIEGILAGHPAKYK
jgi:phosphoglycolate phosphatase